MKEKSLFNNITQYALPFLTIMAQVLLVMQYPQYALLIHISASPFWIYSSWRAYKEAKQIGMFVTAIIFAVITILGIVNYWFF